MPKFIIEREIPGAGQMSSDELRNVTQTSCCILRDMGPQIQWQHSYVTDDKLYCIYISPDVSSIINHAQQGNFPVNKISQIREMIDPTTGE